MQAEFRGPLAALLLLVPVLAIAGWHVDASISTSQSYQQLIRKAQVERGRVLRFQLDEEAGLRGFVATKNPVFLEPYTKALPAMPVASEALGETLSDLKLDAGYSKQQLRRNAVWLTQIAKPLIVNPGSPSVNAILLRGKQIVDDYRNADQVMASRLRLAADAGDADSRRALDNTIAYVIASTILVAIGSALFGFFQARTARRAYQNLVLFRNQKRIADALQEAFLNRDLPKARSIGLHARYIPASQEAQVGGDWYDAFELADGRILFSIGDVAGHGLEAAVVMSRARQAIIAAALGDKGPSEVLERANASIMLQGARMVTAICGYLDPTTFEITYATAGHPAPILARPGHPSQFLPQGGIALGVLSGAKFKTYASHASLGALVVLYTDGVIEYKRDVIDGERRLLEATEIAVSEDDPAKAIERIIFDKGDPNDDVAILTIAFSPGTFATGNVVASVGGIQLNRFDVSRREEVEHETSYTPPDQHPDGEVARQPRVILSL